MEECKRLDISGCELVSLAGSLAICICKNLCKEDMRKLRIFFQCMASNIAIIESEGKKRGEKFK